MHLGKSIVCGFVAFMAHACEVQVAAGRLDVGDDGARGRSTDEVLLV